MVQVDLVGQAGHVVVVPEEFDLSGEVVKVLAGLGDYFVLVLFPGRGGGSCDGC